MPVIFYPKNWSTELNELVTYGLIELKHLYSHFCQKFTTQSLVINFHTLVAEWEQVKYNFKNYNKFSPLQA